MPRRHRSLSPVGPAVSTTTRQRRSQSDTVSRRLYYSAAFCARSAAQRFLVASAIRCRPAADIVRFFLPTLFFDGVSLVLFCAAQRWRCASAMRRRPAALIVRLLMGAPDAVAP